MSTIDALQRFPQSILNRDQTSNLGKLWNIFSIKLDELHVQFAFAKLLLDINTVSGLNLDGIGQLINEARDPGDTDAQYRVKLFTKISYIRNSGIGETIIDAINNILSSSNSSIAEEFPATIRAWADVEAADIPSDFLVTMRSVVSAGISFYFTHSDGETPFGFDGDDDCLGFDDGTGTVGGTWAESL